MNIRQAISEDIQGLLHLWNERRHLLIQMDKRFAKLDNAQARQILLGHIVDSQSRVFVGEFDDKLAGYIIGVMQDGQTGVILEMGLDAHLYHGGLARALVKAVKQYFESQSIQQILVLAPRYHPIEQAFWRTLGTQELRDKIQNTPKELMWMKL